MLNSACHTNPINITGDHMSNDDLKVLLDCMRNVYVLMGIEFAVSRMGGQFNQEQIKKLSDELMDEYRRIEKRREDVACTDDTVS